MAEDYTRYTVEDADGNDWGAVWEQSDSSIAGPTRSSLTTSLTAAPVALTVTAI